MSRHATRGGRAASDRLLADLLVTRELATEAIAAILRNPLLARDRMEDIVVVIKGLEHFVTTDLEKIIRRRDADERGELEELRTRLEALEAWRGEVERGERGERAPIPLNREQKRG